MARFLQAVAILAITGVACSTSGLKANANTWKVASLGSELTNGDRLADPANVGQGFGAATALNGNLRLASEGATLLVPSTTSKDVNGKIQGGTLVVTLKGTDFDNAVTRVGLGSADAFGKANNLDTVDCALDAAFTDVLLTRVSSTVATFSFPSQAAALAGKKGWDHEDLELEEIAGAAPRPLCLVQGAATNNKWSGLYVQTVWDCQEPGQTVPASRLCTGDAGFNPTASIYNSLNEFQLAALKTRTVCCRSRLGIGTGRCINPKTATCCGGAGVKAGSKCCSRIVETSSGPSTGTSGSEIVVKNDAHCPCRSDNEVQINGVNTNSDCAGNKGDRGDATETACCLPDRTKFSSFADSKGKYITGLWGSCLNPSDPLMKCCINGQTYGPTQKCCEVNGVVAAEADCDCSSDDQCQLGNANGRCCKASGPDNAINRDAERCDRFSNFPASIPPTIYGSVGTPTAPAGAVLRCYGKCYDMTWQTCCNGGVCHSKFEKCCVGTSTCCNRHTGTCERTHHWHATAERCSTVEHLSELRAFFVFVLPAALLFASLGSLAIVIVFANRASNRSYSFIESAMVFFATIAGLFALPTFFSPAFKYGVLIVLTALVAIVAAAARIRLLNVGLIVMIAITLWYIFDPTPANHWLSATSFTKLTHAETLRSTVERKTDGLFRTTSLMWNEEGFCTGFYDGYFKKDEDLYMGDRQVNPEVKTFGYCERGWVATLLVLEGVSVVAMVILFVVSLLALVLRFRKV